MAGKLASGKLAMVAAAGTICLAGAMVSQRSKELGLILRVTKLLLTPPYIYVLFNFILFCILTSSFWSTTFKSLLKTIQNIFSIFHRSTTITPNSPTNPEQAFMTYFTRQTSTLFENFHWFHKELDGAAAFQTATTADIKYQDQPSTEELTESQVVNYDHYNRTVPFDDVMTHKEEDRSWFAPPGNDYGLLERDVHETFSFKDDDDGGMMIEQYKEPVMVESTSNCINKEDEESEYEGEEGNDMDTTWKAIMEGKKKTLLMEEEKEKKIISVIPAREKQDPPRSPLYSLRGGDGRGLKDVQLDIRTPTVQLKNKCPPSPQLRRGSGGSGGGSGGKKRGWRRNVMEELVTGQDELYHRAEAFINRFKNGMQLQRLESYQRFLEIINR